MSFGLEYTYKDEVSLYETFTRFLIDEYAKGHQVVLIVDEAQNLGGRASKSCACYRTSMPTSICCCRRSWWVNRNCAPSSVHRSYCSWRSASAPIIISARCRPTSRAITSVTGCVWPGGRLNLFTHAAIKLAYEHSDGIPRLINQYCDQALVYGYAEGRERIDGDLMAQVIEDRRSRGLIAN